MTTYEEGLTIRFLDYLYENYGDARHVKRMAPSVGPVIWKLSQLARLSITHTRQIRFNYRNRRFKGRYSHHERGKLEIVEVVGRRDGRTVCTIRNLTDAMSINIRQILDQFLAGH